MKQEIIIEKMFDMPYAHKYYRVYPFKVGDRARLTPRAAKHHPQLNDTVFTVLMVMNPTIINEGYPICTWFGPGFNTFNVGVNQKVYDKEIIVREQDIPAQALILI